MEDEMGGGHPTGMEQKRNARKILMGKHQRTRPLWNPTSIREDQIKVDLKQWALKNVDWINLTQDKNKWCVFVNKVMDLRSKTRGKFVDWMTMNLSGMTQAVASYLPSNLKARLESFIKRWATIHIATGLVFMTPLCKSRQVQYPRKIH